jgi:glycosyltransferase involved in cell wall biosynthesis
MATTAQVVEQPAAHGADRPLIVCHCTTAHTQLKSRSYHRQLLPLSEMGIGVRYVAPMKNRDMRSGVKLVGIPVRKNAFRRLLAWPELLVKLLRQNASVYHFQDPQLLPLGFALKLIFRRRIVYDAYEDFPAIAAAKQSIPGPLRPMASATVAFAERVASRLFDGVITADPMTLRRFAVRKQSRKLVFYNFPNLDFFPEPRPRSTPFDVVYRGGLSARTGAVVLLEALRILSARPHPPRLLLIGYFDTPAAEQELRRRIRTLGLAALVEIRGRIDHETMADALGEARIGVSPLLAVRKFQINIPVKVFEYWACGLPVVATDLAPMRPFFRHGHAGLLVHPGDAGELAGSIAWLLDHPDFAARMGQRGRQLVIRRFNNTCEIQKLRRLFERIVNPSQRGPSRPCSNRS